MPAWRKNLFLLGAVLIAIGFALIIYDRFFEAPDVPPEPPVQTVPDTPDTPAAPVTPAPPTSTNPTDIAAAQTIAIPGLDVGMDSIAAEDAIEAFLKPETTGNQTYNMRLTPQTSNGYSLIAVTDNMPGGVQAREVTAIFKPGGTPGTFIVSEYTSRVKCAGGNAWQTKGCS